MIVSIIGLGYIGLPTAAVLASKGVGVIGVDVNQKVVDIINKGEINSTEPELDVLVRKAVSKGLLKAVTRPEKADVFIVAVPTPFENNYKPDLSCIQSATKSIAPILERGNTIILESTSPVGTTEKIIEWMREERPDLIFPEVSGEILNNDISVAYCPERILPGSAIRELKENDRIIGGVTSQCAEIARDIYKLFVKADCLITDCRTAELSKLVENSFRDVNIAFANELSFICDKLDVNVWEMINLANRHPRVNILQPGPGVGGHCIAVDPWFIVDSAPEEAKLIRTARVVNDAKPSFVLDKIDNAVSETGKDKSNLIIACLGLSFKPDIDDLRHSPALDIAHQINLMNFEKVLLIEPNIDQIPEGFRPEVKLTLLEDALKFADIIVLLVDHIQFKNVNLKALSSKKIIDTRGIWS